MEQLDVFNFIDDNREPLPENYDLKELKIKVINEETATQFIEKYHYSGTCPSPTIAFGHYYKEHLVNVILYKFPTGRLMAQQVMQGGDSSNTWELIRMVSFEPKPKNLESKCIANTFKYIRKAYPKIKIIISYADNNVGHHGYVYQASNFYYYGQSRPDKEWYIDNERVHTRTVVSTYGTMSIPEVEEMLGERLKIKQQEQTKSRYFFIIAQNKKEKEQILKNIQVDILPYPKGDNQKYDIFGKKEFTTYEE
jgi:hypothetical protein